ncbi:unnamed protein product [Schistosoma turkestanicum]|nr:unnamed protein product [Schistosoma turkestanicum]
MLHSSQQINICVLGSGNVGKSALTLQFMYEEFVEDYEPTKSDSYSKTIPLNGYHVDVSILDTAGQESYAGIMDMFYRNSDGFIIVFSITDYESFTAVVPLLERYLINPQSVRIPCVLVGNKKDLIDQRQVSTESACKLAQQWRISYIETSAKTQENVKELFHAMASDILQMKLANTQPQVPQNKSNEGGCCCIL